MGRWPNRLSWPAASATRKPGLPGAELHLIQLKVKQLQEELGACEATRSGRKWALQLRLRALIIAAAAAEEPGGV